MDIKRNFHSDIKYPSATDCQSLLEIIRPCKLYIKLEFADGIMRNGQLESKIVTEEFSIISNKKVGIMEDYNVNIEDFALYRHTCNIGNNLFFIKKIDNAIYFCLRADGQYSLTVKDLSIEAQTYRINVNLYPVEKDGDYKDAILYANKNFKLEDKGLIQLYNNKDLLEEIPYCKLLDFSSNDILHISNSFLTPCCFSIQIIQNTYNTASLYITQKSNVWIVYKKDNINNNVSYELKSSGKDLYIKIIPSSWVKILSGLEKTTKFEILKVLPNWDELNTDNIIYQKNAYSLEPDDFLGHAALMESYVGRYNNRLYSIYKGKLLDADGYSIEFLKTGKSSDRPSLNNTNIGFQYFDTNLNKPIYWMGTKWVDSAGLDV